MSEVISGVDVADTSSSHTGNVEFGQTILDIPMSDEFDQQHVDTIVREIPGGAANIQDVYPLSPLQEGMLFHHLLNPGGDAYVLLTLLELDCRERLTALIAAFQQVIDRHDALRSAVLWEGLPRPVQVVHRQAALVVKEVALSPDLDPVEQMRKRMAPRRGDLPLQRAPLLRLLVAPDPRSVRWFAVLQIHHIICDHQSWDLVFAEAAAFVQGGGACLPEPKPYREHVAAALAQTGAQDSKEFFSDKLGSVDEPSAPFGLSDTHGDGSDLEEGVGMLDAELSRRVRSQARRYDVSAARLFHAAWALVVASTSGRQDVVYGTVLLAQHRRESAAGSMLGLFVNALPLRLQLRNISVRQLLELTREELQQLVMRGQSPLTLAHQCSGIRAPSPLFTAVLNYRYSVGHRVVDSQHGRTETADYRVLAHQYRTNYPIGLTVDNLGDRFSLIARTRRIVDPRRIVAFTRTAMLSLLEALEHAPEMPALMLQVLPDAERSKVVDLFNATDTAYPSGKLVHEVFEEQAERTPDAIAAIFGTESITFSCLNERANQLARYLQARGAGRDKLIGLCLERSIQAVIGLLAILKAGCAYVPLDPDYPVDSLRQVLKDAAPLVVLTQAHLGLRLAESSICTIALDEEWPQINQLPRSNLDCRALRMSSDQLAYVIYTSGSTGQPKGVMVEHRNVLSLWQGLENIYRTTPGCARVAVNASLSFDASVKQLVQMLSGRAVVLIPQEVRLDYHSLFAFIEKHDVSCIDCTPSQLKTWIAAGLLARERCPLHLVLVGGEAIDPELWGQLAKSPTIEFFNVYGPTESTVDATFARLKNDTTTPHIGTPMQNRRIYILDAVGQPAPIGVAGEIYIGGAGVARGYLNQPKLTTARFLPDPFSRAPNARMYRSGDVGKWRADGTVEYIGRNDAQVKIRGFRVEPGEVEAHLLQHPLIRSAAVTARKDDRGDIRLVAYLSIHMGVTDSCVKSPETNDESNVVSELQGYLRGRVPAHMVPLAWVVLPHLPMTPSGKVDRRALPAPLEWLRESNAYAPPVTEQERVLTRIWEEVLRLDRVGADDDFFDIGGHSLLAMQVITRVRSTFSIDISIRDLFESPTVRRLSRQLDRHLQARLADEISRGGEHIKELLGRVASMNEQDVHNLVDELRKG